MHDAIVMTIGEILECNIHSLRTYCERCGRLDAENISSLISAHGYHFPARKLACDGCGRDELFMVPKKRA